MHPTARSLLSLATVATAALVLLADSDEDTCDKVTPFDITADYTTDCLGGDQGTLHMWQPETPKASSSSFDIHLVSLAGELCLSSGQIQSHGECKPSGGTVSVDAVDIRVALCREDRLPYVCQGMAVASKTQTILCKELLDDGGVRDASVSTCSLTLTLR
jgi:hypothetical protein